MFKRVLSLILCLCVLMSSMPTWTIAVADEKPIVEEIVITDDADEPEPTSKPNTKAKKKKGQMQGVSSKSEEALKAVVEERGKRKETSKPVVEQTPAPTAEPTPVPTEVPRFVNGYARVNAGVTVYVDENLSEKLGVFEEDAVVYVSDRQNTKNEDQDILTLCFACEAELIKGFSMAANVMPLTVDQTKAYETQAAGGVAFKDNVYLLSAAFCVEEKQNDGLEETDPPAVEESTEPVPGNEELTEEETVTGEEETVTGEEETVTGEEETVTGEEETVTGEEETVTGEEETVTDDEEAIDEPDFQSDDDAQETADTDFSEESIDVESIGSSAPVVETESSSVMDEETLSEIKAIVEEMATYFPQTVEYVGGVVDRYPPQMLAASLPSGATEELDIAYITCNVPYMTIGKPAEFTVEASGGTAPYTYRYSFYYQAFDYVPENEGENKYTFVSGSMAETTNNTFTFTPENEGRYIIVMTVVDATGTVGLTFQSAKYETATEEDETDETTVAGKVKAIVADLISDSMSDYRRALVLHDWLTGNADYDETYTEYDPEGVLILGSGVCESYALAYQMLLTEADVENLYVTGKANGGGHAWNLVKMGGEWYHVDCTWDDPTGNGTEGHNYFGLNDAIIGRDHSWNEEMQLPACTATEYNYVLNNSDIVFSTISELDEKVAALNTSKAKLTLYYTGDEALSSEAFTAWMNTALEKGIFGTDVTSASWSVGTFVAEVTLKRTANSVSVVPQKILLQVGESELLTAVTVPENSSVVWMVEDTGIATVDDNGLITAVAAGTTILICALEDGTAITACDVEVTAAEQGETPDVCQHANVTEIETMVFSSITSKDAEGHTGMAKVTVLTLCEDCSMTVGSETTQDDVERTQAHTFNGYYCTVELCGYNRCTHENTQESVEIAWNEKPVIDPDNCLIHVGEAVVTPIVICTACNEIVSRDEAQTYEAYEEDHVYAEGVCTACGTAYCAHEGMSAVQIKDVFVGVEPYSEDEEKHVVTYALYDYSECSDCGGKVMIDRNQVDERLENHEYVNGVCKCGASNVCAHPNMTSVTYYEPVGALTADDNGLTHSGMFDTYVYYDCPDCEEEISPECIEEGVIRTMEHEFLEGTCWECGYTLDWSAAPTLTSITQTATTGTLKLTWESEVTAPSYLVYEIVDGTRKSLKASTTTSLTLTDVSLGEHTYLVRPRMKIDGAWKYGSFSNQKTIIVQDQSWRKAPTISAISQPTTDEGLVKLTWKPVSAAESYRIYELIDEQKVHIATATGTTITLTGVTKGEHTYYVRPRQMDSNGVYANGSYSAAKSITVKTLWTQKPTIESIKQLATEEGLVQIVVDPAWNKTPGYAVYESVSGTDPIIGYGMDTTIEVSGLSAGEHKLYVRPVQFDEDGEVGLKGTSSAVVAVTVEALWKKKPTYLTLKQNTDAEGEVVLSWKPGCDSELVRDFQIRDSYEGGTEAAVSTKNLGEITYDEKTNRYSVTVYNVKEGEHKYTVRPKDGSTYGSKCTAKTITVQSWWKAQPTLSSAALTGTNEVTLKWKSGSKLTKAFSIHDTFDGSTKRIARDYTENFTFDGTYYTLVLPNVKTGTHSYYVRPANYVKESAAWETGTKSASKSLAVKALSWQTPPVLDAAQLTHDEGVVRLKWSQTIPADGYRIYEIVDSKYTLIADVEGVSEYTITGVGAGSHTYRIRPRLFDEETGVWTNGVQYGSYSNKETLTVAELWKKAPTKVTARQVTTAENQVKLTWKAGCEHQLVKGFQIIDAYNGGTQKVLSSANLSAIEYDTQTGLYSVMVYNAKVGDHAYRVRARSGSVNGTKSAAGEITVKTWWSQKPTYLTVKQIETAENQVLLTWKAGSEPEVTKDFQVIDAYNGGVQKVVSGANLSEITYNEKTKRYSVTVSNARAGKHVYRVRAKNGSSYSAKSTAKTLNVVTWWSQAPTKVTAKQVETAENQVKLTWKAGSAPEVTKAFQIIDAYDGGTQKVVSSANLSSIEYDAKTGLYSVTVFNAKVGDHAYCVRARNGSFNGTKSSVEEITVKTWWSQKPTYLTVKQVETAENQVLLTWKAGSAPEVTKAFQIIDAYDGGTQKVVSSANLSKITYNPNTQRYSVTVSNVKVGEHKYCVRAKNGSSYSAKSTAKTIEIVSWWKKEPEFSSVKQTDTNEVTLTWKAGSALTKAYSIHDTFNGSTKRVARAAAENFAFDGEKYTLVITGVEAGKHSYYIRSASYDEAAGAWTTGAKSSTKSVTVVNWNSAPTLKASEAGYGKVSLTWTHPAGADFYQVYELIDGSHKQVGGLVSGSSLMLSDVVEGVHTYSVRPIHITEDGSTMHGTMSKMVSVTLRRAQDLAVTGVEVSYAGGKTSIKWNEAPYADGYKVYAAKEGEEYVALTDVVTQTSCVITAEMADEVSFFVMPLYEMDGVMAEDEAFASDVVVVIYGKPVSMTAAEFDIENKNITVSWTASEMTDVTKYEIYRNGERIGSTSATVYTDTETELEQTYTYTVDVIRPNGVDGPSDAISVTTPKLAAPQNAAVRYEGSRHYLTWDAVPGADEYDVVRSINGGEDKYLFTTSETDAVDAVSNLDAAYSYRIIALTNINGKTFYSDPGEQVSVKHSAAAQLISAVYDPNQAGIVLTWEKPETGDETVTAYVICDAKTGDQIARIENVEAVSYVVGGVRFGGSYAYELKTEYGKNVSEGNSLTITLSYLGQVKNVVLRFFSDRVDLAWDAVENAQKYEITRAVNGGAYEVAAVVTETTWTDEAVGLNTKYTYKVQAIQEYADGTISRGPVSAVATADIGEPAVLKAEHSLKAGGALLTWNASAKKDVDNYSVFRKDGAEEGGSFTFIAAVDAKKTRYVDTAAEMGKTYTYMLVVARKFGEDGPSNEVVVTTKPLESVSSVTAVYEDEKTILTWELVDEADYYDVIQNNSFIGDTWSDPLDPSVNTFTAELDADDDLTATYEYRITSAVVTETIKEDGTPLLIFAKPSDPVAVTRGPKPVVNEPTLTKEGVRLTWKAIESDKLLGYTVLRDGKVIAELIEDAFYTDTTAVSKKTYTYKVVAVYSDGTMSDTLNPYQVPAYVVETEENGDGTVTLTGFIGTLDARLVLPATINGKPVTKIGEYAFANNTTITSVTIRGDVVEICDGAFANCTKMTSVILPNTVEVIGVRAFYNCTSLSSMTCQ